MTNTPDFTIEKIKIATTSSYTGRLFYGPYEKTPEFVSELKEALGREGIYYEHFPTVSIYYSDPEDTAPEKLTSFHGVSANNNVAGNEEFGTFDFSTGDYLAYSTTQPELIWNAFLHIYEHAGKNGISLSEAPPVLLSSFENNQVNFSFYFKIED
ncbi:MAG: GyrI-like domain-containing protein [Roseivirga sp.]|nr:GyrI-like domain-containing protein [Roseivirga sp.]